MDRTSKAEQIVDQIIDEHPVVSLVDQEEKLKLRTQLIEKAKSILVDRSGEEDWNVQQVYQSLAHHLE